MDLDIRILKSKINYNKNMYLRKATHINKIIITMSHKYTFFIEPFFIITKIFNSSRLKRSLNMNKNNKKNIKYKNKNFANIWIYVHFANIVTKQNYIYLLYNKVKYMSFFLNKYM